MHGQQNSDHQESDKAACSNFLKAYIEGQIKDLSGEIGITANILFQCPMIFLVRSAITAIG